MMGFQEWVETNDDELWEEFNISGYRPWEWDSFVETKYNKYCLEELFTESMVDCAQNDADEHPWVNE